MKYFVIHLNAGHTAMGNPRRCFLIYNKKGVYLAAIDEGYKGMQAIPNYSPDTFVYLHQIITTAKEYRDFLKNSPNKL